MRLKLTLLAALLGLMAADTSTHTYENGEHVELWVNKVGVHSNTIQLHVEAVPRSTWSLQTLQLHIEARPMTKWNKENQLPLLLSLHCNINNKAPSRCMEYHW